MNTAMQRLFGKLGVELVRTPDGWARLVPRANRRGRGLERAAALQARLGTPVVKEAP